MLLVYEEVGRGDDDTTSEFGREFVTLLSLDVPWGFPLASN